jgi:hypothetical protein
VLLVVVHVFMQPPIDLFSLLFSCCMSRNKFPIGRRRPLVDAATSMNYFLQYSSALLSIVQLRLPEIEKTYLELVRQHKTHYMQR